MLVSLSYSICRLLSVAHLNWSNIHLFIGAWRYNNIGCNAPISTWAYTNNFACVLYRTFFFKKNATISQKRMSERARECPGTAKHSIFFETQQHEMQQRQYSTVVAVLWCIRVRGNRNANVTCDRQIRINAYFGYKVSFDSLEIVLR